MGAALLLLGLLAAGVGLSMWIGLRLKQFSIAWRANLVGLGCGLTMLVFMWLGFAFQSGATIADTTAFAPPISAVLVGVLAPWRFEGLLRNRGA